MNHLVLIKLLFPIFLLFPFASAAWDLSAPRCDYAEQPFSTIPRDSLYQKPYTPKHQRTAQLELALKRARCFQKAEGQRCDTQKPWMSWLDLGKIRQNYKARYAWYFIVPSYWSLNPKPLKNPCVPWKMIGDAMQKLLEGCLNFGHVFVGEDANDAKEWVAVFMDWREEYRGEPLDFTGARDYDPSKWDVQNKCMLT